MAALYRRLLLLRRLSQPRLLPSAPKPALASALLSPSRHLSFASAEDAAAERRRRKRQLRIEPPLHAQRRDPSHRPPPRDPNAPRLPDTTSALVGPRLSLHNRVQSLIRSGDLDGAAAEARAAIPTRVRPTVFTCNAVAAAMVRAGRHGDAVALFDSFFRRHGAIVPNVVSYNTLILAHCEAARVDDALQAYQEMLDGGVTSFAPSAVSYRHLTKGLVAAGRIQDALELLHAMFHRGHGADSIVYKNLIDGYISVNNWDKAFELFDELREKAAVYDGVVHTSFMEGYWNKGMDREAMENYKSLLDRNFRMTPATCNVLLETLFEHGKRAEANDLWETMIDNHTPPSFIGMNSESYNVMVNQCFKEGRFREAVEVFHRQPRRNVQMDVGCFNNIIGKLCENGMVAEAEKLFQEMESKSVLPDVYTYTYMVDSCFKEGRVDDTLQYFYKMADGREHGPKFNIGFFNRMFQGLSEAGRVDDALKVYGRMPDKEIKPNTTTFEILVKALCKEGELDRALELVRDMARSGVVAPPEFRETVGEIFKNADRHEEMEKAFEEKPVPLPPKPRPEARPHSSPQGLPGFASNQTRGSYTPHQGQPGYSSPQPFHPRNAASQVRQPEWMSPKPQQPVFGNQEVKKEEVAARKIFLPTADQFHHHPTSRPHVLPSSDSLHPYS
ncbi:pentatricopeptide repeat-containing protein At1g10270-like [Lolium rigidum]|uniref:pentatricopeptide repeat-containing protein At1g10270-like n=1 Tax=Lolium rigidum TaxID=89674 RepID=UPI001F5DA026|nr:pentatricopeptide repeat-containing protein At1g10270-like [Lolium rigidum]